MERVSPSLWGDGETRLFWETVTVRSTIGYSFPMWTTLQLDDDLLEAAENRAQRTEQALNQVIAGILRKAFKTGDEPAKPFQQVVRRGARSGRQR